MSAFDLGRTPDEELTYDPKNLVYKKPFTKQQSKIIHIKNESKVEIIVFRVRHTDPRFYKVRPRAGYLKPGESTQVCLILKAVDPDILGDAHKVNIQSLYLSKQDLENYVETPPEEMFNMPCEMPVDHKIPIEFEYSGSESFAKLF